MNMNPAFRILMGAQAALVLVASAGMAAPLRAEDSDDDTYMGEAPDRYAQVKAVEGDVRIRKGDDEEALDRNIPVAEGDVVESRGRGVLQLGDGTRIAFGENTRLHVAALFMDKDGSREVLLRLERGRIRIKGGGDEDTEIRVDTPSGTAKLQGRTVAGLEVAEDHTVRVKVSSGHLAFRNEQDEARVSGGERLTVYGDHDQLDRIRDFNTFDSDSFDSWSDRYFNTRKGESYSRVPAEIRNFSDDLDGHGEWVYVDEYSSWCWRPTGLAADWRPYYEGRWAAYPGGMTWIDAAPWGFVTCHYGRWGWRAGFGWCWVPGVYYSPAWVAWHSTDGYIGWAPMGYRNTPCTWGYGGWGGGFCWNIVSINHINVHRVNTFVYRDPVVINRFHTMPPAPGAWPNRPMVSPWHQRPLIVRRDEFRNPVQIQNVIQNRSMGSDRFRNYERQAHERTGREVFRRPEVVVRPNEGMGDRPHGFEDRSRLQPRGPRPMEIRRPENPRPTDRPSDRPGDGGRPIPRPETRPDSSKPQTPQPRFDPRRDDHRSEAPRQDSPRQETPHQDPPRQETPRPTPRPERGTDGPRERPRVEDRSGRETPRTDQRDGGRMERRPDPGRQEPPRTSPFQRQDPRPEPRPEQRQDRGRPEPPKSEPAPRREPERSKPEAPKTERRKDR